MHVVKRTYHFARVTRKGEFIVVGVDFGESEGRPLAGAALLGVGWGLTGLCPGPALDDLAIDPLRAGAFVVPMLAGLLFVGLRAHRGGGIDPPGVILVATSTCPCWGTFRCPGRTASPIVPASGHASAGTGCASGLATP